MEITVPFWLMINCLSASGPWTVILCCLQQGVCVGGGKAFILLVLKKWLLFLDERNAGCSFLICHSLSVMWCLVIPVVWTSTGQGDSGSTNGFPTYPLSFPPSFTCFLSFFSFFLFSLAHPPFYSHSFSLSFSLSLSFFKAELNLVDWLSETTFSLWQ